MLRGCAGLAGRTATAAPESWLRVVRPGAATPTTAATFLGGALREQDVRLGLERAYRLLASLEPDQKARYALVDQANAVRPRTVSLMTPDQCPSCAQPVAETDRYCERCGQDLNAAGPGADVRDVRWVSSAGPPAKLCRLWWFDVRRGGLLRGLRGSVDRPERTTTSWTWACSPR